MLAEHLFFTTAIAIVVGMFFFRYTGRDSSWIVIVCAYAPDLDKIADYILNHIGFTLLYEGHTIHHGTFHNIAAMVIFGIVIAFLLNPFGIKFIDAFSCAVIGFGAHLFEDALVYSSSYMYLWPLSTERMGWGILPMGTEESYNANFFHFANTEVLLIGIALVAVAAAIRTYVEGPGWIRWYMPEKIYTKYFGDKTGSGPCL